MIERSTSETIVTSSLADEIAFRLQAAILDGSYPPGTHLLQDELCTRFGVSRTPVREALRKLQAQHLVVVVPNRGAKVRVPSRDELIEVYTVRAELEGFASELAAGLAGPETFTALDTAQARIDEAVAQLEEWKFEPDEEPAFHRRLASANEDFHGAIHRAARNHRLQRIIEDLEGFFPKDYVWRAMRSSEELRELHSQEHWRIRDAVQAGAGKQARREMSRHILHARTTLLGYLDEHGFWRDDQGTS
jgi:DNA-binding GntR family transcriptional regulator